MIFNYIRISTTDKNNAGQLVDVDADRVYEEIASTKTTDRPQLQAMLSNLRGGDVVNVHELSRMARSVKDLIVIVEAIFKAGSSVYFHKENLRFEINKKNDPIQNLMLNMLASIAQFESELLLERQKEGIAIAKIKGKYKGRKAKFTDSDIKTIKNEFVAATNRTKLAKKWGISRQYLYQIAS